MKRKTRLIAGVVALYLLATTEKAQPQLSNAPWPMFQHDLQHTGRSSSAGPNDLPPMRWQFAVEGRPGSPALGPDGTIYLPTGRLNDETIGYLYAITPEGTQKWRYQFAGLPSMTAPAIAADGTIYVHMNGDEGNVVAIEKLYALHPNGILKWIFQFNNGAGMVTAHIQSSPAIASDGTIYVASMDTRLYAINPEGALKWRQGITTSSMQASPIIDSEGTIYVQDPFELGAFSPQGVLLWHTQLANSSASSEASPSLASDGTIYIGEGNELQAYRSEGTLRWKYQTAGSFGIKATPALATDGTIYVSNDGLYALNPEGTLKWKFAPSTFTSAASPTLDASGTIYWLGYNFGWKLYAVTPNGAEKWNIALPTLVEQGFGTSCAIGSNGALYVAVSDIFNDAGQFLRAYSPPMPGLSINDVTVNEGNTGTMNAVFEVNMSAASAQVVTVDYATAEGTASGGNDYVANSGTLTFSAGTTTQTITVVVNGDAIDEADETFFINLGNPTNANIADNQGQGTINDDDGTALWTPLPIPTTETMRSLHFVNANKGWAVGYGGTIIHTLDGGAHWMPQTSGTAERFLAVRFVDENNGWAGAGRFITRTTDGGTNWINAEVDPSPAKFRNSLFAVSATQAWAPANSSGVPNPTRWFSRYTVQGGSVLEEDFCVIASSVQFVDMYFIDPDNGWAAGTSGQIIRISNASSSPSCANQSSGTAAQLNGLFMLDANTGWIAGNGGTVLKTVNGGANWTPQTSGTTTNLKDIHFVDSNNGWAVGENGLILATTNGGATWSPQSSGIATTLWSVFFSNPGYAAGGDLSGGNGVILKTLQGGQQVCATFDFPVTTGAWYLISLPVIPDDRTVDTLFPGAIAAFEWNYASQNYAQVSVLEPERAYWLLMLQAATAEVCGLPVDHFSNDYSSQGWDMIGSVAEASPLVDDPDGSVIAVFGWNPQTQSYFQVDPFVVEPKQGYWVLVFNTPCTVSAGSAGAAATSAITNTNAELAAFQKKYGALPPPPPFAVTNDQLTINTPRDHGLSQNYPNPFNPETVIEYQLPQPGKVSLKVYNLLGHEIRILIDEEMPAGFHHVKWDGKDEAGRKAESGIYLYKLETQDFVQTRKTVLLK